MDTITIPQFELIGLALPSKTTNVNGQSGIDCGNLWQQFEKADLVHLIPGAINEDIYAVYYNYEGDEMMPFSYFIGCKVKPGTPIPVGLQGLEIPKQQSRKFVAKGIIPDCITAMWQQIWLVEKDRSFGYDYEIYTQKSKNWKDAEVDIFVSIL